LQPKANLAPAKLSCRNLWKAFGDRATECFAPNLVELRADARLKRLEDAGCTAVLVNASFEVSKGEIFVIMGLSGSGKSTLIRCLSRLWEPSAGEVMFDGHNLVALSKKELMEVRRHRMGMVFQHFGLLPHLTIEKNIAFPLKIQGYCQRQSKEQVQKVISLVGLEGKEECFPSQLSGGQQQRVGIARSLIVDPELWFLDEPFSALDPLIRRQMQDEFIRLQTKLQKTILFVTHDFREALKIADRVAIMKEGRIVQLGRPADLVLSPIDSYVRAFTSDVPLARVLRAEDILKPGKRADSSLTVDRHETAEALLPILAGEADGNAATVVDENGTLLGQISLNGLLDALVCAEAKRRQNETASP
jgi:glycine betaine/proline transport system ATP-binding protein